MHAHDTDRGAHRRYFGIISRLKKKYKVKEVVVKESKVDTGIKRHSMLGQFAPGELEMQLLQHVSYF